MLKSTFVARWPGSQKLVAVHKVNGRPYPARATDEVEVWETQKLARQYLDQPHIKAVAPNLELCRITNELLLEVVA